MDLLPHTNFDVQRVRGDMGRLAPEAEIFEVSSLEGSGMDALCQWLLDKLAASRAK
jgi:hydrogenase nickel incorporation protein HypB